MKAMVLNGVEQALTMESRPDLVADAGWVVVQLRAAALNRRDVWIQMGQYGGLKFPIVLGSDGCGTTVDGRTVIIDPALDWGLDSSAQQKDFRILGLPDDGTLAEQVLVPSQNVYDKPVHLNDEQAAALPLAGLTAYRALFTRAGLQAGERVLVTGIGAGTATLALQFAQAAGAQVWVTSGKDVKLQRAAELGAQGGVNYNDAGWDKQLVKNGPFDVIIDSAGGDGFSQLIELARPGGRIANFGATVGNPSKIDLRRVFWKQLSILGTTMGSPQDFAAMLGFVRDKKIIPVVDQVFPLAEANTALQRMRATEQFGKIILAG
jgi:zinc-binding alcohol dehydrogenase/oxidoreductase